MKQCENENCFNDNSCCVATEVVSLFSVFLQQMTLFISISIKGMVRCYSIERDGATEIVVDDVLLKKDVMTSMLVVFDEGNNIF